MRKVNLVNEAHAVIAEISDARKKFRAGKIGSEQGKSEIGFFNATSRAINTAIQAERWQKQEAKSK